MCPFWIKGGLAAFLFVCLSVSHKRRHFFFFFLFFFFYRKPSSGLTLWRQFSQCVVTKKLDHEVETVARLQYLPPVGKAFKKISFQNDLEETRTDLFPSNSFHLVCSPCALREHGPRRLLHLFHVLNLYIFCSLLSYSCTRRGEKNIQIDLFWHTQPSAERVKSIQPRSLCRLTCLHARAQTQTHTRSHRSTWTLLFGSVLFAVSSYMLSLYAAAAAAAALELYLVRSKSEHLVRCGNEETRVAASA